MKCGNTDFFEAPADVERRPVFAGRIVIEPVKHVHGNAFAVQSGMRAKGQGARLECELRPRLFEPIACFAQLLAPRIYFQQLQSPTQG